MTNTREITAGYRLTHWAGIMKERAESGLTVKAFCAAAGFHPNSYFYWQRKLREAACVEMPVDRALPTPCGWVTVASEEDAQSDSELSVEIGKCRVYVGMNPDEKLLTKVFGVLVQLC